MSAQARCSSTRTASPDAEGGFPQHPIWNIQPEGLGDMLISDKPFANFWTNCSSCPEMQPRIDDDGPAAVASCTAHHLFRTGAVLPDMQHTELV